MSWGELLSAVVVVRCAVKAYANPDGHAAVQDDAEPLVAASKRAHLASYREPRRV